MKNIIFCIVLFVSILFSTPVPVQASQFSDIPDGHWDKVYIYPEKKVTRWDAMYFFQTFFYQKMYQMPADQVLQILARIDDITVQSVYSTDYRSPYPGSTAIADPEYTISYSHLDTGEITFANGDIDALKA